MKNYGRIGNTIWLRKAIKSETIDERYKSVGGFTHGFDYMRLILASAVVVQHSLRTSYGQTFADMYSWGGWHRTLTAPILLMFFALSGFLVAGSLKRKPTATAFVTLRAIRLVPALAVEVLLSAIILGPLLTSLPLIEYFSSKTFFEYFGNIVGQIKFALPGVFGDLPNSDVNVSLWTVPFELECYLVLLGLWFLSILKFRVFVAACTVAFIAFYTRRQFNGYNEAAMFLGIEPRALVAAFLCGLTINLYSEKIKLSIPVALLMVAGLIATTLDYRTVFLATIFAAYLVVYLGMSHPPKRSFLLRGDYSYGLYLFAYPIQQTYTYLFVHHREWYFNVIFTLIFGLAYAAFSWWVIEKPILSKKREIVGMAESIVNGFVGRFQPGRAGRQ